MASIFSRIIAGEIPCYKVAEDEHNFAFLDINPVAKGHVLCIPKHEVDYLFDLSDEEYASLMLFVKRVAEALKKTLPCVKVGEAVLGLEVPVQPFARQKRGKNIKDVKRFVFHFFCLTFVTANIKNFI